MLLHIFNQKIITNIITNVVVNIIKIKIYIFYNTLIPVMAKTEQQLHSEILQDFVTEKSTVFVETVVHFFSFSFSDE